TGVHEPSGLCLKFSQVSPAYLGNGPRPGLLQAAQEAVMSARLATKAAVSIFISFISPVCHHFRLALRMRPRAPVGRAASPWETACRPSHEAASCRRAAWESLSSAAPRFVATAYPREAGLLRAHQSTCVRTTKRLGWMPLVDGWL